MTGPNLQGLKERAVESYNRWVEEERRQKAERREKELEERRQILVHKCRKILFPELSKSEKLNVPIQTQRAGNDWVAVVDGLRFRLWRLETEYEVHYGLEMAVECPDCGGDKWVHVSSLKDVGEHLTEPDPLPCCRCYQQEKAEQERLRRCPLPGVGNCAASCAWWFHGRQACLVEVLADRIRDVCDALDRLNTVAAKR